MVAFFTLLLLGGAPQGISVKVVPLEARGAVTSSEAGLVSTALEAELRAQGYGLVSAGGKALIAGTLEREKDQPWVIHVTLVSAADQTEINDVRLRVGARDELAKAGTEAAKKLATEIRVRWGVRTRLKLR